jgi:membrane associated rhomboid family serine protease
VLAALIGVHLARQLPSPERDEWLVLSLAFIPARYTALGLGLPGGWTARFTSFVTHAFVHADAAHLLINSAWLLAFGSIVARRVGAGRFLALLAFTGAAGAAAFWAGNPGLAVPVVGASGAVSGLTGAVMRFLFKAIGTGNGHLLSENPAAIPRAKLGEVFRDRRALMMLGVLVATNLLLGLGLGTLITPGGIAWEAHLGGLAAGLFLFQWFDRQAPVVMDPLPEQAGIGH